MEKLPRSEYAHEGTRTQSNSSHEPYSTGFNNNNKNVYLPNYKTMGNPALTIQMAKEGHSMVITGQCGTGKTHLLKEIVKELSTSTRAVAVTASTGMATSHLGYEATTLHHWAGIVDGRYSRDKLGELFDSDDQFASARERISGTDCLIIDEIGMLSAKVFDDIEFAVRHVKKNHKLFGGIQVIGAGDFKQLSPVPNHMYGDEGLFCFQSNLFRRTFPHHVNLQEVLIQSEAPLIRAVNELCDGSPSEETVTFIKSLARPLDVPDHLVTRLFGTNFDAQCVNHEILEEMDEQLFVFHAKDEGNVNMLRNSAVPKTLMLKKGANVILVRNLGHGLYNGMQGTVHELSKDNVVINFSGKLVPVSAVRFDIYDNRQHRNIACRVQLPVILAYALTVHRAQGQTLEYVDIDCFSFFAAGQMGVAVGRATNSQGLRIVNFNNVGANRKHPEVVYEFYKNDFSDFQPDVLCCKITSVSLSECHPVPGPSVPGPSADGAHLSDQDDDATHDYCYQDLFDNEHEDLAMLQSPWDIVEFCTENKSAYFLSDLPVAFFASQRFQNHINFLYYNVMDIVSKDLQTSQHWTNAYSKLNSFIVSDLHMTSILRLFQVETVNKHQNKLSSKLVFWLMDNEVNNKAKDITVKQSERIDSSVVDTELSSASKGKIRYLAGACVQKIAKRLKESVLRKMGQCTKNSKLSRKMDYKKQHLLKQFRINESDISETDESMNEIEFKQGPGRGLTIVNDSVYGFFIYLNTVIQRKLNKEQIHSHFDTLHDMCRLAVDTDDEISWKWISLFDVQNDDAIEDELFLTLVMELFRDITEYFIRIAFVDAVKKFKASVPRKKKQALRTKIQALGERDGSSAKKQILALSELPSDNQIYICTICQSECEWEPTEMENESIACDKCNGWFHYKCVNIKGNESFLKRKKSTWFCTTCSKKGKGRGKSSKRK